MRKTKNGRVQSPLGSRSLLIDSDLMQKLVVDETNFLRDVRVVQPGNCLRLALKPHLHFELSEKCEDSTLIATVRFRRVSRAL